jgi:hypothetical protein
MIYYTRNKGGCWWLEECVNRHGISGNNSLHVATRDTGEILKVLEHTEQAQQIKQRLYVPPTRGRAVEEPPLPGHFRVVFQSNCKGGRFSPI